jgi:hypothetical protein
LVEFSSSVHGFLVVQPMFNKFESLRTSKSHQDWESSTWLIQMHIKAFRMISSVVIFKLSSCDPSPPVRRAVGGSSKVHKMSYTHPNSIPSVAMSLMNEKVRSWVKECFCVLERCEKIKFSYFDKFSHFTHFDEMKNLRTSITFLSTLTNLSQTLTLSLSSSSPKPKYANEA